MNENTGNILEQLSIDVTTIARIALGDGISRAEAAEVLKAAAYAIETQDVAEDMSPIVNNKYTGIHRTKGE
jgi:hypothetical protein